MSRWVVLLLVLLVAGGGVLGWRAYEMSDELDAARAEIDALEERLEAEIASNEEMTDELASGRAEDKALSKQLHETRRELRDRQRCGNYPTLVLSPRSGPPGTRVEFFGYCFVGDYWGAVANGEKQSVLTSGYGLFIINPAQDPSDPEYVSNGGPNCELIASTAPKSITIRDDGTARGFLTIPQSGACFQEDRTEFVTPGEYHIGLGCHSCSPLAVFRVTS